MLGDIWKPTYPLVWPTTLSILGACASTGAATGLHALGAARRSLSAMVIGSALSVVLSIAGTVIYGVVGAMAGAALVTLAGCGGGQVRPPTTATVAAKAHTVRSHACAACVIEGLSRLAHAGENHSLL